MTTSQRQVEATGNLSSESLIDKLRACHTPDEILEFEGWFNLNVGAGPLHRVICELLRNRSISRAVAAKWLSTLLQDRDEKLGLK